MALFDIQHRNLTQVAIVDSVSFPSGRSSLVYGSSMTRLAAETYVHPICIILVRNTHTMVERSPVACCMLYTYDYLLFLSKEIDLIWSTKWNTLKVFFFFQRYFTFVDIFVFFALCESFPLYLGESLVLMFMHMDYSGVPPTTGPVMCCVQ
jgi:hypothetical protein